VLAACEARTGRPRSSGAGDWLRRGLAALRMAGPENASVASERAEQRTCEPVIASGRAHRADATGDRPMPRLPPRPGPLAAFSTASRFHLGKTPLDSVGKLRRISPGQALIWSVFPVRRGLVADESPDPARLAGDAPVRYPHR
jgi:hypothetical protein